MPLLPVAYTAVMAELLYAHSGEMAGIYDLDLALALQVEQKLGELKSRFVSMASHEFRTPLAAVLTTDLQSALHQGTTVTISLPLTTPD